MPVQFARILALMVVSLLLANSVPAAEPPRYERSIENYTVPDVVLINQNGDKVRFKALLESGDPVAIDFIYATCTTICPILSAGYANLQRKLGSKTQKVHLVSITIDPENDTPAILKEYLAKYSAKPGWDFLTGSRRDIERVMTAFNAYFSNKMDHQPLTFIRSPQDGSWIRLYGLLSGVDFVDEYKNAGNP